MTTRATEPGIDAPGWCEHDVCEHGSIRGDCPFCVPALTFDELTDVDLRLALRCLLSLVECAPGGYPRYALRLLDDRAFMGGARHVIALRNMLRDRLDGVA